MHHLSASEWATVISAGAAAVAALAAAISARASLKALRATRVPHVSGGVTQDMHTGGVGLIFANAGPTLATQVMYIVIGPPPLQKGGAVASGLLAVGQEWKVPLPPEWMGQDPIYLVWGWRDLDDNVYYRNDAWETKRISRRRYLRQGEHTLGYMFQAMYPNVPRPRSIEAEPAASE